MIAKSDLEKVKNNSQRPAKQRYISSKTKTKLKQKQMKMGIQNLPFKNFITN